MNSSGEDRFKDPLTRVYAFIDHVLVRCPTCDACAVVLKDTSAPEPRTGTPRTRRRLRCGACGLSKDELTPMSLIGAPVDPFYRLPLWLQANFRGHILWAYNVQHLDLLESYVAARLRERGPNPGPMSMLDRLPSWLKSAKNRDEILRTITRLRATLPAT